MFAIYSVLMLALASGAAAQDEVQPTLGQLSQIRPAVVTYQDLSAAQAAGYEQCMECMSNSQRAQGQHFTNGALIEDPVLDPLQPEALMYETTLDGRLRLIGVEHLVF